MGRKIAVEVEVPEGFGWMDEKTLENIIRHTVERLLAHVILEKEKASSTTITWGESRSIEEIMKDVFNERDRRLFIEYLLITSKPPKMMQSTRGERSNKDKKEG